MAAPTGSFLATKSGIINEIISRGIDVNLPSMSPFWKRTMAQAATVDPSSIGRDLFIIKNWQEGLAGVIEDGGARGDFTLYGDNLNQNIGAKLFTQGNGFGTDAKVWPDPLQGANPLPYRQKIHLRSQLTNLALTVGEMEAEAVPAFTRDVLAPKFAAHAALIAMRQCVQLFVNQNLNMRICRGATFRYINNAGATSTGGGTPTYGTDAVGVEFSPDNLAIDRFAVGMRVQFWVGSDTATTATPHTAANLKTYDGSLPADVLDSKSCFIITKIDELTNRITARHYRNSVLSGTGTNAFAPSGTAIPTTLTVEISAFGQAGNSGTPNSSSTTGYVTGIAGLRSWMKVGDTIGNQTNDNTLMGLEADATDRIDVNQHPAFKTMSVSRNSLPLTEHVMMQIVRRYNMAKRKYGQSIDTFLASDGVWLAYLSQKIGQYTQDRGGKLSSLNHEGTEEGMTLMFDGRKYVGETDSFVEANTVYGIKTEGGNWKKAIPPSKTGNKWGKTQFGLPFELVARGITGLPTDRIPMFRNIASSGTNGITEFVQMPGRLRMQMIPDQPAGLIISDVAEDRLAYQS